MGMIERIVALVYWSIVTIEPITALFCPVIESARNNLCWCARRLIL